MPTLAWKRHVCSITSTQTIITICIHQALMTGAPTNPISAKELLAFVFILIYHSAVSNHVKLKLGLQVVVSNANRLCLLHMCLCDMYIFWIVKLAWKIPSLGMKCPLWPFTVKVGHVKAIDIHLLPKQQPARWSKLAGSSSPPLYKSLTS